MISPFDGQLHKPLSHFNICGLSLMIFVYDKHRSIFVIVFSKFDNELRNSIKSSCITIEYVNKNPIVLVSNFSLYKREIPIKQERKTKS